jgi:hypothetical protein
MVTGARGMPRAPAPFPSMTGHRCAASGVVGLFPLVGADRFGEVDVAHPPVIDRDVAVLVDIGVPEDHVAHDAHERAIRENRPVDASSACPATSFLLCSRASTTSRTDGSSPRPRPVQLGAAPSSGTGSSTTPAFTTVVCTVRSPRLVAATTGPCSAARSRRTRSRSAACRVPTAGHHRRARRRGRCEGSGRLRAVRRSRTGSRSWHCRSRRTSLERRVEGSPPTSDQARPS